MANRKIDPREQFSKKLAGRAEWFWFFYMVILAAVMVLQPASALPAVYLGMLKHTSDDALRNKICEDYVLVRESAPD